MANPDSVKETSSEFSKPKFKNIDAAVYKQLIMFLGIAVVITALVYLFIIFEQDQYVKKVSQTNAKTSDQVDKRSKVVDRSSKEDQQRKNDIYIINSAIKAYYLDPKNNKKVPEKLSVLVPTYLRKLPKDPSGSDYQYTPGQQSWSLTAILSDGKEFKISGP